MPAAEMARVRAVGYGSVRAPALPAGAARYRGGYDDLPARSGRPLSAPIDEVDADGVPGYRLTDTASARAATSRVTTFAVNP